MPATAPTVTVDTCTSISSTLEVHATDVDDAQDAVAHAALDRLTLAVASLPPKLSPVTVTDAPPEVLTV